MGAYFQNHYPYSLNEYLTARQNIWHNPDHSMIKLGIITENMTKEVVRHYNFATFGKYSALQIKHAQPIRPSFRWHCFSLSQHPPISQPSQPWGICQRAGCCKLIYMDGQPCCLVWKYDAGTAQACLLEATQHLWHFRHPCGSLCVCRFSDPVFWFPHLHAHNKTSYKILAVYRRVSRYWHYLKITRETVHAPA